VPECIKPGCDGIEDEKQPDEPGGTGGPVAERQPSMSISEEAGMDADYCIGRIVSEWR
jgi:hypothetical protein